MYVVSAETTTPVEPLAAPPVEKLTPELEVFGEGHDHVIVAVCPVITLAVGPGTPPGGVTVTVGGEVQVSLEVVHADHTGACPETGQEPVLY